MKVGFFDSGIGGLSVLHLARRRFSDLDYIYYADRKHVPYGEKSKEEVVGYVDGIIRFFMEKNVDAVVIACNTATSAAVSVMREKYSVPIIGMEPAVKKAIDTYGNQKVLVAATPITVNGDKLHGLLKRFDKNHLSDLVALPGLVRFAESGEFDSENVRYYLKNELGKFSLEDYSCIVLGCTHFNYFKDSLRLLLPVRMKFVDGNEGTVNRLASCLGLKEAAGRWDGRAEYYDSGRKVTQDHELEQLNNYFKRLDKMFLIE